MSVCSTAKRRRRQANNGYRHLAKKQRPKYKVRDVNVSKRRLQRLIETERRISQRKK